MIVVDKCGCKIEYVAWSQRGTVIERCGKHK